MIEVRGGVEVDFEGVGAGTAGGVLTVEGFHINRHFRCRQWPIFMTILLICWILPDSDSFFELSFCMKVTAEIVEFSHYAFMRPLSVTR